MGARPRRRTRTSSRGSRVDSRWWYWIAATPAVFVFWLVAVAWVAVAVSLGPLGGPDPVGRAGSVSLVAFGGPFLVLVAVFPFAVFADATAVLRADVEWAVGRTGVTVGAAIGPLATVAAWAVDLLGDGAFDWLGWAVALGFVLTVPVAGWYLYRRHEHLGVP